jgi:hypothetical protein
MVKKRIAKTSFLRLRRTIMEITKRPNVLFGIFIAKI